MVFRWTIWGDKENTKELLRYSVLSFQKFFGKEHRYIIITDNKNSLSGLITDVEIIEFKQNDLFNIDSVATWKKWCPSPRISINEHEFYVDSDVFLVNYPTEILDFLNNEKYKFAILDEFKGQSWQHGSMCKKATDQTPYVNAGLFIQKSSFDITQDLFEEFDWWNKNITKDEVKHHDEQGSLAIALTKYHMNNEILILPKDQYLLIGENENIDIDSLENVKLFHAVYPTHPAFHKFKNDLDRILYE